MALKCKYCHAVLATPSQARAHSCKKKEQAQSTAATQQNYSHDSMADFTVTHEPAPFCGGGGSFGGGGSSGGWDSGSSSGGDGGGGGGGGD